MSKIYFSHYYFGMGVPKQIFLPSKTVLRLQFHYNAVAQNEKEFWCSFAVCAAC
jgi:hypothetical protein